MWHAESKTSSASASQCINPIPRYYVPKAVRHHIDYITPGIKLLEVKGVKSSGLEKRGFPSPIPPIIRTLTLPLDELLSQLLLLCDVAVTPPCIEGVRINVQICYVADLLQRCITSQMERRLHKATSLESLKTSETFIVKRTWTCSSQLLQSMWPQSHSSSL